MPRPPSSFGRQHGHVQSASMVAKSLAKDAWRRFRIPVGTIALPKRWWEFFRISGWDPRSVGRYVRRFWWARHSRTCRLRGRRRRGDLPGSRRPLRSEVYSEGANSCRHSRWDGCSPWSVSFSHARLHGRSRITLTLHNTKLCPRHRIAHRWLHRAYPSSPSLRSIPSSSRGPDRLG